MFEPNELHPPNDDEEVDNDAIQLLTISIFNGLCRVIAALASEGRLTYDHLANIHDAMTAPLDDPDWRDYGFITETRESLVIVLSQAVRDAQVSHRT